MNCSLSPAFSPATRRRPTLQFPEHGLLCLIAPAASTNAKELKSGSVTMVFFNLRFVDERVTVISLEDIAFPSVREAIMVI